MRYTLPREKAREYLEKLLLPERRLSPLNFVQKFKDGNVVIDVYFPHYRKVIDEKPQQIIRL